MDIEFDPVKNQRNIETRSISFETVAQFEFDTAIVVEDKRQNYGETRYIAMGYIGARLHVLVYTQRETALRVISLRKANQREVAIYAKA